MRVSLGHCHGSILPIGVSPGHCNGGMLWELPLGIVMEAYYKSFRRALWSEHFMGVSPENFQYYFLSSLSNRLNFTLVMQTSRRIVS